MNKPFKTIEEQIEILNSRGVKTDENTADILLRESYYSVVNGYKTLFLFHTGVDEKYKYGTTFNEIYRLFLFDRSLRMLLFKYIAIAEASLKTLTAYTFSEAHKSSHHDYLELGTYRDDGRYPLLAGILINEFRTILGVNPKRQSPRLKPYIKHYMDKYKEVPIWVLMNYLTLGQAIRFYDFQKDSVRFSVADTFARYYQSDNRSEQRIKYRALKMAFDHIKDIRNICAHDERLYCARVSPRSDTTFAQVIEDLSLVLPAIESNRLRNEIIGEIVNCSHDIKTVSMPELLRQMGLKTIDDLVSRAG